MHGKFYQSEVVAKGYKLMDIVNNVVDIVIISLLWVVCSLPIVTSGLASAAMFHTTEQVIQQGRGTVWSTYTRSLRENWGYALPINFGFCILFVILGRIAYVSGTAKKGILIVPLLMSIALIALLTAFQLYLYPLLGHYVLNFRQLAMMVLQLTLLHPLKSLLLLVLYFTAVMIVLQYPPLVVFIPGCYTLLSAKICIPLFLRYLRLAPEFTLAEQ